MDTEKLKTKYFPRVPWTEDGPVRRRYRVYAADGGDALAALTALAEREGFTEPGQRTVAGDAAACLAAFRDKAAGAPMGMVFGVGAEAHFCDLALEPPDTDGWRTLLVRSEEGENLTALAHATGILRFRRA